MVRNLIVVIGLSVAGIGAWADEQAKILEVKKIWDQAAHNAFTDLVRFKDQWFCVFREGKDHVSPDGALRIITSTDGEKWESAALLKSASGDLRDAKIPITPNGELMLSGAEAVSKLTDKHHQSRVGPAKDGRTWDEGIDGAGA